MRSRTALLILLLAAHAATAAYRLEEIPLPPAMSPEISAVAFSPRGTLVVANRHGDIWRCDPAKLDWRRFAHGLHEPLGLVVAAEDDIYVCHKPELTRLRDSNGDGVADHYQTLNGDWGGHDNWHEHTFGLRRDADGNFIVALGLPDTAGPINTNHPRATVDLGKVHKEKKLSAGPWQGWLFKITPRGELIPWASGFRQPSGVGLSPAGDIFITDQQGDYIGSSPLVHVQPGRFYGHPASLKWDPQFRGQTITAELLEQLRVPPAVVLPHGSMGGSPGEPVWDTTGGKFGPFTNQVFIGDFTKLISRVCLERVLGEYQGACFPFLRDAVGLEAILTSSGRDNLTIPAGSDGKRFFRDAPPLPGTRLRQGNNRLAFAPDGSLYLGQTTRGWAAGDGLQRLVWTGETPVEIHTMSLTDRGFALAFTAPMNSSQLANPQNYRVNRFRYLYHDAYGSPRVDPAIVPVLEARPTAAGDRVELALDGLEPGFIYELELDDILARDGQPIANPLACYTLNRLRDGRTFTGPLTRPLTPPEQRAKPKGPDVVNLDEGRRIYALYCATCHQADGRGGGVPGVAAADFTAEQTPLLKPDAELLAFIAKGVEGKPMPAFGEVLSETEMKDTLAFIRAAFGRRTAAGR